MLAALFLLSAIFAAVAGLGALIMLLRRKPNSARAWAFIGLVSGCIFTLTWIVTLACASDALPPALFVPLAGIGLTVGLCWQVAMSSNRTQSTGTSAYEARRPRRRRNRAA